MDTEYVRGIRREAACTAAHEACFVDVPPPSPRCAEILLVLNQILDSECGLLTEGAL